MAVVAMPTMVVVAVLAMRATNMYGVPIAC